MTDIFEDEDTGGLTTSYTLQVGYSFFGSLQGETFGGPQAEPEDYDDFIKFVVEAGQTFTFEGEFLTGDSFEGLQATLIDANGDFVRKDDLSLVGLGDTYTFTAAGTYFVAMSISDAFDYGTYRFDLGFGEETGSQTFLTPLATYFDELSVSGEHDILAIQVEAGNTYRIVLDGVDDRDPDNFDENGPTDTYLAREEFILRGDDGTIFDTANPNDNPYGNVVTYTAFQDQTLYLDVFANPVNAFGFDVGAYSVQLDLVTGIYGTVDADIIAGSNADDAIYGLFGNDRVFDGKGADVVNLGAGNDYVRVGGGEDLFIGGAGIDYISYYDSKNGVTLNLGENTATGSWAVNDTIDGFESASGSKTGSDHITGSEVSNVIKTYGGNDRVFAGKGEDRVELGDGNDYVRVGGGIEDFDGGSGKDYISYYDSRNGIRIDLEKDTVSGSWAVNDTIKDFESASGSGRGRDSMLGTSGSNTLKGWGGNDTLYGRSGDDKLYGGKDDDRLDGGAGTDLLYGGTGSDTFHFDFGEDDDIVKDYEAGIDKIELDNFNFTSHSQAMLHAVQVLDDVMFAFDGGDTLTIENATLDQVENSLVLA